MNINERHQQNYCKPKNSLAVLIATLVAVLFLWQPTAVVAQETQPVEGKQTSSTFKPPLGKYVYTIIWGNSKVAEATVTVDAEKDHYRVTADTKTTKAIDRIYKIRYKGEGLIASDDYAAVRTILEERTRARKIRTEITYAESGEIETVRVRTKKKKEPRKKTTKLAGDDETLDTFSAVFLARSFDWRVGLKENLKVFDGKKNYLVTLNCVDTAPFTHRDAEIECWVIVPSVIDLSKPKQKSKFSKTVIYISADPSRHILKLQTKASIGTVKATMERFVPVN